jgi:hypothetical protein
LEERGKTPIDERIKELEEKGLTQSDIVLTLYDEGYPTHEIMKQGLSLAYLRARRTPWKTTHPPGCGELCALALFFIIDRGMGDDFRRFIQGGVL